ncbi:cysteine-rich receptor-like protein kinase 29 [Prunus avium]|uniref:Cysteine-rich receptor-like protein kinase 29 n=1 Tax=Prunus avium TaxID=42229 RepID=A0A6P5TMT6_PRUAV|nr:cysteine-rich receptor-like protein kinase 29 [Prunus avium]
MERSVGRVPRARLAKPSFLHVSCPYWLFISGVNSRSCLNNSRYALTQRYCPNQKEAIGWYSNCMLRYSNRSMYGVMETKPSFDIRNPQNVSSSGVDGFNQELRKLLESVRRKAAAGGSLRKFAYGNATAPTFQTIFAIAQCTPELSEQACSDSLVGAFGEIPQCCIEKVGGRVSRPSCNFRFEVYRFIEPKTILQLPSPPPILFPPPPSTNITIVSGGLKSNTSRTVIIIVMPIVVSLVLIISIGIWLRVRQTKKKLQSTLFPGTSTDEIRSAESLQFDFDTIRVATYDFSEANKLGQGGFGSVYKGRLFSGEDIAVKRLSVNSEQGDLEFQNEVLLVAKLQHRNLVRLLGFCLEGIERLLIYEFVPNASLDRTLFDPIKRTILDWDRRYKIIEGISRGLIYLHTDSRLRIIHRDLKASNILIDGEMNPKISDFGMAKLFPLDQTQGRAHYYKNGYMTPEYVMYGHLSIKLDVYSFGVLVLEIVIGQKNSCFRQGEDVEHLLSYAWKSWREGTASNLIDPTLRTGSRSEIMRCLHIGLLCVQENIADRPTMASIVLMLNSYSLTLLVPSQPAFFMHTSDGSNVCVTTGSDRSKTNSLFTAPEDEVSLFLVDSEERSLLNKENTTKSSPIILPSPDISSSIKGDCS